MTADSPLTDDDRAQLDRALRAAWRDEYSHASVVDGLAPAVESILSARETALRETIAQEIKALHPARINSTSVHEQLAYKAGTKDAARIVRGQA